ncbi:hypothetical protein PG989_000107 [Apiospora arundinis]
MERRYVPIKPAVVKREDLNPDEERNPTPAKRRRTVAACEECRSKKVACDGIRPSCTPCVNRKVACIYMLRKDGPRGPWLDYIELIERLSTFPEADALNLLRRLRESNDLCAVLSPASGGARDKTRSTTLATNQLLISPVFTKLESELGSLHPIAYPWLSSIDIRTICREARNRFEARAWIMAAKGDSTSSDTESSGSPSLLCDSRLYHLRMDYWTRVPISDELAARVISSYLVREHPMLGLFDAELFVTDLVERRIRFCTPFLLSALMFYACHLYAPIDPGTLAIANSFLSEAETLWISERASDSITTVAGTQLLRITTLLQSSDQQSVAYSHEGRLMAGRMKLFGVAHSADNASHFATLSTKWQRATAHTAWGVYNCFAALGIFQLEYDAIPYTPILPIPGEHATEEFERFGVTWPAHPLPNYVGHTFGPLCKLWTMDTFVLCRIQIPKAASMVRHVTKYFCLRAPKFS